MERQRVEDLVSEGDARQRMRGDSCEIGGYEESGREALQACLLQVAQARQRLCDGELQ